MHGYNVLYKCLIRKDLPHSNLVNLRGRLNQSLLLQHTGKEDQDEQTQIKPTPYHVDVCQSRLELL